MQEWAEIFSHTLAETQVGVVKVSELSWSQTPLGLDTEDSWTLSTLKMCFFSSGEDIVSLPTDAELLLLKENKD